MSKELNSNKLNGKDLINAGIFSAIYVVIIMLVACTVGMIPIGFILLTLLVPLLEGIPISIARSILKNAPIIILDEATASIDSDNESYIQEAIDALVNGKILLVIAHRLNTIKNANQILVLDEGKITEHGTHEELIIQDGLYRCLWSSQQNTGTWKIN